MHVRRVTTPLVSIILPAFNHEAYVLQTLESLVEQDYPNKEILIVNDGSTDSTGNVISDWMDGLEDTSEIRFIERENRGLSATLNELLSMARGDFIAGASSDDYLLPGSVTARVDYLRAHPDKRAVFGDYHVVDEQGRLVHSSGISGIHDIDKAELGSDPGLRHSILHRFSVAGPVLMFDRRIFEQVGIFDESLHIEDWDMYLRMSARGLLGFIDTPVAAYRVHEANSIQSYVDETFRSRIAHIKYQVRVLQNNKSNYSGADLEFVRKKIRKLRWKMARYSIAQFFEIHRRD